MAWCRPDQIAAPMGFNTPWESLIALAKHSGAAEPPERVQRRIVRHRLQRIRRLRNGPLFATVLMMLQSK